MKGAKKGANTTQKEVFNEYKITYWPIEEIIKEAKQENDTTIKYPLAQGVTMVIVDGGDADYDYGRLEVMGVSINVKYRSGKNGYFMSMPSYQKKNGEYANHVLILSKNMIEKISEVLSHHYGE